MHSFARWVCVAGCAIPGIVLWPAVAAGTGAWQRPRVPAAHLPVGVNYHATTSDFETEMHEGYKGTAFLRNYDRPTVRHTVRDQLQEMADAGADIIKTTLWLARDPSGPDDLCSWKLALPFTQDELRNIRDYAADVGRVRARDGHYLELDFTIRWSGCADYATGTPETTVGQCGLTWPQFLERAKHAISELAREVGPVRRADARIAVSMIYLEAEVMVGTKANQERFLKDLYPYFLQTCGEVGVTGSLCFKLEAKNEQEVFNDRFMDAQFPLLSKRPAVDGLYRSVEFLRKSKLPIPRRLDLAFFPAPTTRDHMAIVQRVWVDLAAVFPNKPLGIVETGYLADPAKRVELGDAFLAEFKRFGSPQRIIFWTTPDGGGPGANAGFPFDFKAYGG